MTVKRRNQLGLSAVTFLVLCVAFGPRLACSLLCCVGLATVWILACRRWPGFAWFSWGFVQGLFGIRGGYYGRRRRW
jgi:hypothetical protein